MNQISVIGWTSWDDPNYPKTPIRADDNLYMQAVADALRNSGYHISGHDHQNKDNCVPIMSDGTKYCVSLRHWGSVMSMVYGKDYVYWM